MTTFPTIPASQLLQRLEHPGRKIRLVLDTDAFNEIDDQFAIAYALKSADNMTVEALYAAPFFNELSSGPAEGMEKSYQEILNIRRILGREDIPVYRGSTGYLPASDQPVESEPRAISSSGPWQAILPIPCMSLRSVPSRMLHPPCSWNPGSSNGSCWYG